MDGLEWKICVLWSAVMMVVLLALLVYIFTMPKGCV